MSGEVLVKGKRPRGEHVPVKAAFYSGYKDIKSTTWVFYIFMPTLNNYCDLGYAKVEVVQGKGGDYFATFQMTGVLRVGPFRDIYIFAENFNKGEQSILTSSSGSKKKVQQKVDSVESLLQSLGLDKYAITFQAEEVDMAALVHMSDEDLKAMGIPMGPRKKILLELESKRDD